MRAAVASLPAAQRRAVELAYFEGHTYRQVADALGIPEGTAKSRLRLALARIAETVDTRTERAVGMTDHEAVQSLLAPYALDAVDVDEVLEIEAHLDTCPECVAALAELRDTVDLLAALPEAARPDRPDPALASRTMAAALAHRPARPVVLAPADIHLIESSRLVALLSRPGPDPVVGRRRRRLARLDACTTSPPTWPRPRPCWPKCWGRRRSPPRWPTSPRPGRTPPSNATGL